MLQRESLEEKRSIVAESAFEDQAFFARWFSRQVRVLGTRATLTGKFKIIGDRRSGVHVLTRVLASRLLDSGPLSVQSSGSWIIPADVTVQHIDDPIRSTAEQDARANAGTCHASCDGMRYRNEAADCEA
jgi:hypothetical protein